MDRKIEMRGLASSFSNNIDRRLQAPETPPRESATVYDKDDSDKNVISNWLEKTKESLNKTFQTPDRATPAAAQSSTMSVSTGRSKPEGGDEPFKTYETPVNKSFTAVSESPLPKSPFPKSPFLDDPTVPESYELNVLKYQQFFNNRPLCQCLDDDQPEGGFFQRDCPAPATESTEVGLPTVSTSPKRQEATEKSGATVSESGAAYSDSEYSDEQEKRDPAQAHKFWNNVRSQLWISDDSLDGDGDDDEKDELPLFPSPANSSRGRSDSSSSTSSGWVMMRVPSKWSYTGSMERGNIYLGEHCPLVPDLPSPCSLGGPGTNGKAKEEDSFLDESEGGWAARERQAKSDVRRAL
ncbi:hypothetical protein DL766_004465 [Monosporascus sp. MC13-8B]|uniref:Uncharacterized protein n=1 Tax=Monosporascus cannonballus TaxID=155416 RepID=A0ABY0H2H2_9PEZI|nr:hypothetical protein DL762_006298 [Monosporascus cannonballus]RYP01390.1 hypothetical protein DL763_000200 [Monosporascus cannonballus]RYP31282.1 hypothetical protein DL766_004465 [Monosporascus sp. MC13-8B]